MMRRKQCKRMSGSGRHCAVRGCHWTQRKLKELLSQPCFEHPHQLREHCPCPKPFTFHAPRDDDERRQWYAALRRKNPPSTFFVCSFHFIDKKPTKQNPLPQLYLGFEQDLNTVTGTGRHKLKMRSSSSKALLERTIVEVTVKATDLENGAEKMYGCRDGARDVCESVLSDSLNSEPSQTLKHEETDSATNEVHCTLDDNRQHLNMNCVSSVGMRRDTDGETDCVLITANQHHDADTAHCENVHDHNIDCIASEQICLDTVCAPAQTLHPLKLEHVPSDLHCHDVDSVPRENEIRFNMDCASSENVLHPQVIGTSGTTHEKCSISEVPERVPRMFDASTQWTDFSQQDHSYTKMGSRLGDGPGVAPCKVCSKGTATDKVSYADAGMQCDGEDTYQRVITNESDALLYTGASLSALKNLISHLAPCKKSGFVKLSVEDQILITLMKLKLNLLLADLARRFHISESLVSKTITFWRGVMLSQLSQMSAWLPPEIIQRITSMQSPAGHASTLSSGQKSSYDE